MAWQDRRKVHKYIVDRAIVCSDCHPAQEWDGKNCEAEARRHVIETGHIVTIHETYDMCAKQPPQQLEG